MYTYTYNKKMTSEGGKEKTPTAEGILDVKKSVNRIFAFVMPKKTLHLLKPACQPRETRKPENNANIESIAKAQRRYQTQTVYS